MRYFKILTIFLGLYPFASYCQSWQQLGNFNRPVNTLYADSLSNLLYLGGRFKWNNNDTLNGICYWDGQQFYNMEDGLYDACFSNGCQSTPLIIRYGSDLYIGNVFKEIDSIYANGIAKWDGQDWDAVGGSLNGDNGQGIAWGGCVHEDKLYVAGFFRSAGGDTCNSIAYWDGIEWHGLGFPPDLFFGETPLNYRCIFYKDELYVGGNCYNDIGGGINCDIARFDGTTWKQVGLGLKGGDSNIRDMIIYKDELYVCGYFKSSAGNAGNKIMRWNGVQWSDVSGGLCSPSDIPEDMMVYNDKLYVVGIFDCVGNGLPTYNIATWDGERWCSFGNSHFNNKILCIGVYNGEVYVGGGFTEIDGYPVRHFAKWIGDHSTDTCSIPVSMAPEPQRAAQLVISPNPTGDYLNIQWRKGQMLSGSLRVFDGLGKEVLGGMQFTVNEQDANLQTGTLPPGLYFLNVQMEDGQIWSGRFVKR